MTHILILVVINGIVYILRGKEKVYVHISKKSGY